MVKQTKLANTIGSLLEKSGLSSVDISTKLFENYLVSVDDDYISKVIDLTEVPSNIIICYIAEIFGVTYKTLLDNIVREESPEEYIEKKKLSFRPKGTWEIKDRIDSGATIGYMRDVRYVKIKKMFRR